MKTQLSNQSTDAHSSSPKKMIALGPAMLAMFVLLALAPAASAQQPSPLTIGEEGHRVHILPPPGKVIRPQNVPGNQLIYHGGPVMLKPTPYVIFWAPPTLQDGKSAGIGLIYQLVQYNAMRLYSGHGIANNNTQYYGYNNSKVFFDYIQNAGGFGGFYVDTNPYPASGCNDPLTPGDCISDAQIQTEIANVMALKGWTGGPDNMFLVFTSQGEGSCMGPYCAYTDYCAYHGYFSNAGTTVIYGNEPYGDHNYCQAPGTPSPNYDPDADTAASAATHELTEAITDPMLNAWYDSSGYEIGDLCAYNYGPATWDFGMANQSWNLSYFELQMEYDNHTSSCVQVGP